VREYNEAHNVHKVWLNAFFNPFAMLLVSLDGQNNYKVFFEMLQLL